MIFVRYLLFYVLIKWWYLNSPKMAKVLKHVAAK